MVVEPTRPVSRVNGSASLPDDGPRPVKRGELTEAIHSAGSARDIARITGVARATAERYRNGSSVPDAFGLMRLMKSSRRVLCATLRAVSLNDEVMDLEEATLARELRRLQARRGENPHGHTEETAAPDRDRPGEMVDDRGPRA